ncbi:MULTISPECIES: hypothetical protein [Neobacillus]|jgi:hypothetical protein|uniref:Uncharacterized protein n=3 Tax=Neobacillus TaxID=2675232 RepID=A0A6B3TRC0_9BACI|nr:MULTISPECIES: hypothetical protein [Neobacillus]AIM16052.1 hypothetical protein HW35_06865 [Bacillus sp. X1(2014)]MCD4840120.1 hypothetical protein [Neobacillus sedimentimangrovi]MED3624552.1 hypothetical protein [Neobacillus thermocopriae]MED3712945.1 hypothetical protein [Neobacillus thermocopriae]NEX79128.1 hypothetical protein [Neobacillus thermocopriae]
MFHPFILSLFLYFPEDKSEYFPALISFSIFLIAAIFTMRWIIRISKREAQKAKELEEKINQQSARKDS